MDWKNKFPQENRYFETDNGILYCGDCLKILKQFPDNYIDLVLTDPPYNIADEKKLTRANYKILSTKNAWGNEFCDYWDSLDDYIKWVVDIYGEIINKISDIGSLISFFDRNLTGLFIYYFKVKYKIIFRNKIYFLKKIIFLIFVKIIIPLALRKLYGFQNQINIFLILLVMNL